MIIKINCFKKKVLQEGEEEEQQRRKINEDCAICIEKIHNEVQLICSHSFCAHCIINYGEHTFNMVDISCPICRGKSKILFANFERDDSNKDYYDKILNYNHEFTENNYTSLCFCVDLIKLFIYYMKQIANFNNPRYNSQRSCFCCLLMLIIIYFIMLFIHDFKNSFEVLEDIFYYICIIIAIAEYFYRNFRRRTNNEFEIYSGNSREINSSNRNSNVFNPNVNLNSV